MRGTTWVLCVTVFCLQFSSSISLFWAKSAEEKRKCKMRKYMEIIGGPTPMLDFKCTMMGRRAQWMQDSVLTFCDIATLNEPGKKPVLAALIKFTFFRPNWGVSVSILTEKAIAFFGSDMVVTKYSRNLGHAIAQAKLGFKAGFDKYKSI